jgi:hypothetical protein
MPRDGFEKKSHDRLELLQQRKLQVGLEVHAHGRRQVVPLLTDANSKQGGFHRANRVGRHPWSSSPTYMHERAVERVFVPARRVRGVGVLGTLAQLREVASACTALSVEAVLSNRRTRAHHHAQRHLA